MGVGQREKEGKEARKREPVLAPVRPGCFLFLASFPSFSLWPTPIDRVSPNRWFKARHEADSFEPAEWSERLTSRRAGWLGAAAVGSIPALVTFFSFSSLSLLSSKPIFLQAGLQICWLSIFHLCSPGLLNDQSIILIRTCQTDFSFDKRLSEQLRTVEPGWPRRGFPQT